MVSLGDVKASAATLFAQGQHLAALRLYDALVAAAPDVRLAAPADAVVAALDRAERAAADAELPAALHPIPLLSALSEAAFRRVLGTLVLRRLPAGALVIREGEPGNAFYFVASGRLRVYATDGLGRQTDLAELGETAVFGEMALLSAQPRSASVVCATEVDLLEAGQKALAQLADELGAVAEALHGFTRERLLGNLMATSPLFRPFQRMQQRELVR